MTGEYIDEILFDIYATLKGARFAHRYLKCEGEFMCTDDRLCEFWSVIQFLKHKFKEEQLEALNDK